MKLPHFAAILLSFAFVEGGLPRFVEDKTCLDKLQHCADNEDCCAVLVFAHVSTNSPDKSEWESCDNNLQNFAFHSFLGPTKATGAVQATSDAAQTKKGRRVALTSQPIA